MSTMFSNDNIFHGRLRNAAPGLFWLGLVMVLLGLAAILFPIVATLAATVLVGWLLVLFGIFALAGAFCIPGTGHFFAALLLGLLALAAGFFLLFSPQDGAVALTLLAGVTFLAQGSFEMAFALQMRPYRHWGGMLLSGIASIMVALFIILLWPGISLIVLGVLLGVNFLTTGFAYIAASRTFRG